MEYRQEMNLQSRSGYCMPFEQRDGEVKLLLGYGRQKNGVTEEEYFHHGVDLETNRYILRAVADGVVSGIGSSPEHGLYIVIRYGKYEVVYARLSNALVQYGTKVRAGSVVAISSDMLHMEVKFDGEEMDPLEFLAMIYHNLKSTGKPTDIEYFEMDIPTAYDDDREEIEELMMRFYPTYLSEISDGLYRVPDHTEQSLRNIFSLSAIKNYFLERMPSYANPLGIGGRAMPIAAKVQNLLIADFLNYMALRHEIYLSSWSGGDKKKVVTQP
jgi:hypothetical protein